MFSAVRHRHISQKEASRFNTFKSKTQVFQVFTVASEKQQNEKCHSNHTKKCQKWMLFLARSKWQFYCHFLFTDIHIFTPLLCWRKCVTVCVLFLLNKYGIWNLKHAKVLAYKNGRKKHAYQRCHTWSWGFNANLVRFWDFVYRRIPNISQMQNRFHWENKFSYPFIFFFFFEINFEMYFLWRKENYTYFSENSEFLFYCLPISFMCFIWCSRIIIVICWNGIDEKCEEIVLFTDRFYSIMFDAKCISLSISDRAGNIHIQNWAQTKVEKLIRLKCLECKWHNKFHSNAE